MSSKEFGKYLKEKRNSKGLTVSRLADLSGVSQSYLTNVENNKRGTPSPDILKKLEAPLGVPYFELMFKAGHYDEDMYQFMTEHDQRRQNLDRSVMNALRTFTEDRYFRAIYRDEIFMILKDFMVGPDFYNCNDYFESCLIQAADDTENVTSDTRKDVFKVFDKQYNMKNLKDQFTKFVHDEAKEKILSELTHLATKHGVDVISEIDKPNFELADLLKDERTTYNGHSLTGADRQRILDMMAVLFRDRK